MIQGKETLEANASWRKTCIISKILFKLSEGLLGKRMDVMINGKCNIGPAKTEGRERR